MMKVYINEPSSGFLILHWKPHDLADLIELLSMQKLNFMELTAATNIKVLFATH